MRDLEAAFVSSDGLLERLIEREGVRDGEGLDEVLALNSGVYLKLRRRDRTASEGSWGL